MKVLRQRQNAIRELLLVERQVQILELARRFGVSTMTIRRDLAAMEAEGCLIRTFGGGIAVPAPAALPLAPFRGASSVKQAIGQRAASLVQPGQTVIVDAGTTTLEVVRHLPRDAEITLVTNSLPAAQEMLGAGMQVLLLGGYVSTDEVRIYGPLTEACLANLHADLLFVGCVGASATHGFSMSDLYLTSNVKAMVHAADRVVVVAESGKFHQRALSCYALPSEVSVLVSDDRLSADERHQLAEQGVDVLMVEVAAT